MLFFLCFSPTGLSGQGPRTPKASCTAAERPCAGPRGCACAKQGLESKRLLGDLCSLCPKHLVHPLLATFQDQNWPFFCTNFGKEFPSRNSCRGRPWNCPLCKLCAVPLALQNRAVSEGEKGEKCQERGSKRVTSQGCKKEKRTRENRSEKRLGMAMFKRTFAQTIWNNVSEYRMKKCGVLRQKGPENSPELATSIAMEFHCRTSCTFWKSLWGNFHFRALPQTFGSQDQCCRQSCADALTFGTCILEDFCADPPPTFGVPQRIPKLELQSIARSRCTETLFRKPKIGNHWEVFNAVGADWIYGTNLVFLFVS